MLHQIFQHFPDFGISEMKDAKQNDGYGLAEDAGTNKFTRKRVPGQTAENEYVAN